MKRASVLAVPVALAAFGLVMVHDSASPAAADERVSRDTPFQMVVVEGFAGSSNTSGREPETYLLDTRTGETWRLMEHASAAGKAWVKLGEPR